MRHLNPRGDYRDAKLSAGMQGQGKEGKLHEDTHLVSKDKISFNGTVKQLHLCPPGIKIFDE